MRIIPFNEYEYFNLLKEICESPKCVEDNDRISNIYDYLAHDAVACKTILVEESYVDGDFLNDYSYFYSKCFEDTKRFCIRLHFFDIEIKEEELHEVIAGEKSIKEREAFEATLQNGYLGFVVIKPLPYAVIGRTCLALFSKDEKIRAFGATHEYRAYFAGIRLNIKSLAFQEQDTVVAACATIALWSAFHALYAIFGIPIPAPSEITAKAFKSSTGMKRKMPSRGLNAYQICDVIKTQGMEFELREIRQKDTVTETDISYLTRFAAAYLACGLPTLLLFEFKDKTKHAVTVAGTGYKPVGSEYERQKAIEAAGGIPLSADWIEKFYVHDDQICPFAKMELLTSGKLNTSWDPDKVGGSSEVEPLYIIVPVCDTIRINFEDVYAKTRAITGAVKREGLWRDGFFWDIKLFRQTTYKRILKEKKLLYKKQKLELLTKNAPRFLWVAGLALPGERILDFVWDASGYYTSSFLFETVLFNDKALNILRRLLDRVKKEASPQEKAKYARGLLTIDKRFILKIEEILKFDNNG